MAPEPKIPKIEAQGRSIQRLYIGQTADREGLVFRRQFLLTAVASVLATAATAEEQKADAELDLEHRAFS
jgi:hypothetical protein